MRCLAPASSANLGPGFDCLGVALNLYNEIEVVEGSGSVRIVGEGAAELPSDSQNLVLQLFREASELELHSFNFTITNRIPLARGLGSSTAAAAIGLVAGWEMSGREWVLTDLFNRLVELDGHPDNAAPCVYGGWTLATQLARLDEDEALVTQLDAEGIGITPIVVIPQHQVSTADARAALPDQYSRAETMEALAGASRLVTALATANIGMLERALHADIVHEQQRAHLVPELAEVRTLLATNECSEALGATISGAGPSILVWCVADDREVIHGVLDSHFSGRATVLPLETSHNGVQVLR